MTYDDYESRVPARLFADMLLVREAIAEREKREVERERSAAGQTGGKR